MSSPMGGTIDDNPTREADALPWLLAPIPQEEEALSWPLTPNLQEEMEEVSQQIQVPIIFYVYLYFFCLHISLPIGVRIS